ncbi:MAG: FecR family protein [Saprospiraceae bacterium]|nr:FecR family protein [Saprospiraceae bacterium]
MSNKPISPELLEKYLAGESSAEETRKVENWYAKQTGEKDYLSTLSDLDKQLLEEETLKKIKSTIGIPIDEQEETPVKLSFWRNRIFQMGVAASFLLACWGGWLYFRPEPAEKTAETLFALIEPIKENTLVRFVNKDMKLVKHRLPDGTQVSLYPNAELTYPTVFEGKTRQVNFIGEGFFDVAHDSTHPFLIQSDKMQIRVLGTKFSVKALPKRAIFQVSVVSGSVAVRSMRADGQANPGVVLLKPQQKALFEVATNQLKTLETVAETKKEIFESISINFNDTPLSSVANQLEKQFDIRIELSNSALSKCLLTADFNNQSLPTILEILCASLDATYTLSGDSLILKGAGCE